MATTRVALVSDTHLSSATPEAGDNWDAVVRYVDAGPVDLVVHLGDLSLDGASVPDDLDLARRQLDRLPVPWYAVPGNHDVGDNPWLGLGAEVAIDAERRARWLGTIGADFWCLDLPGWRVLGVDAQLLASDIDVARDQWDWLGERLGERDDRSLALIGHKPWTTTAGEMAGQPPHRFMPAGVKQRFDDLLDGRSPALVASGHVHQHRVLHLDGTTHVWVPTAWAVLPERVQPTMGTKRCGLVALDLHHDGTFTSELAVPEGLRQLTTDEDFPNPYAHGRRRRARRVSPTT